MSAFGDLVGKTVRGAWGSIRNALEVTPDIELSSCSRVWTKSVLGSGGVCGLRFNNNSESGKGHKLHIRSLVNKRCQFPKDREVFVFWISNAFDMLTSYLLILVNFLVVNQYNNNPSIFVLRYGTPAFFKEWTFGISKQSRPTIRPNARPTR